MISATSASLLRSEWSPSTMTRVTGPGIAVVSRSSSSGVAKASRRPETKRQGSRRRGEVLGAKAFGPTGGMERVADQDESGHLEPLGRRQGAHAAPEGPSPDGDAAGRDAQSPRPALRWHRAPSRCTPPADPCGASPPPVPETRRAPPRRPRPSPRHRWRRVPTAAVRHSPRVSARVRQSPAASSAHHGVQGRGPSGRRHLSAAARYRLRSTSAMKPSLTGSGRNEARKELRANWATAWRPRSNVSATAARLSAT